VGIAKEWITEAILNGTIPNEHDAAYQYLLNNKDEALRRGDLFDAMIRRTSGPEKRAMGAIKDAVFNDPLPDDNTAALAHLEHVKEQALASDD